VILHLTCELTVDREREVDVTLPPLFREGVALRLDAPVGHAVNAPHQKPIHGEFRSCLEMQKIRKLLAGEGGGGASYS